jgi:hypothetical protein
LTMLSTFFRQSHLPLTSAIRAIHDGDTDAALIHLQDAATYALAPILTQLFTIRTEVESLIAATTTPDPAETQKDRDMATSASTSFVEILRAQIKQNLAQPVSVDAARLLAYKQCRALAATQTDRLKAARALSTCQTYVRGYFDSLTDTTYIP